MSFSLALVKRDPMRQIALKILCCAFFCVLTLHETCAMSPERLNLAALEQPALVYEPALPFWDNSPNVSKPLAQHNPSAAIARSPLRLNGTMLRAPGERKNVAPSNDGDPMNRFTEQRLLDNYGTKGWEQLAVDGQLRLAPAQQRNGFAPYVTGGMGVTQLSSTTFAEDPTTTSSTLGLRYGVGVAYSLGDVLDLTAGYRANRIDEQPGSSLTRDRMNMQMLDFGLRYRY